MARNSGGKAANCSGVIGDDMPMLSRTSPLQHKIISRGMGCVKAYVVTRCQVGKCRVPKRLQTAPATMRPRCPMRRFQVTVRDLFRLMLMCALGCAWWVDHQSDIGTTP